MNRAIKLRMEQFPLRSEDAWCWDDLSEELIEVANKELNETEENIRNGLKKLQDHITDNSSIRCSTDARFLIRFLRAKKYRFKQSIEILEKFLSYRTKYPDSFGIQNPHNEKLQKAVNLGLVLPLHNRDHNQRKVILVTTKNLGANHGDLVNLMMSIAIVGELLLMDPANQIRGITLVIDASGIGVSHMAGFPVYEFLDCIYGLLTAAPIRYKNIFVIGAPKLMMPFVVVFKSLLHGKLKKRLKFMSTWTNFLENTDVPGVIFPTEYGGEINTNEIIENIFADMKRNEEHFRNLEQMGMEKLEAAQSDSSAFKKVANMICSMRGFFAKDISNQH